MAPLARLVFAGERRSERARRLGATWLDGRLAGKTLHDALRACGVSPTDCVYLNVFHDDPADRQPCDNAIQALRSLAAAGATVIGLGRLVQRALRRAGVAHVPLTHPAARGSVRARATYQQRVRETLAAAGAVTPQRGSTG